MSKKIVDIDGALKIASLYTNWSEATEKEYFNPLTTICSELGDMKGKDSELTRAQAEEFHKATKEYIATSKEIAEKIKFFATNILGISEEDFTKGVQSSIEELKNQAKNTNVAQPPNVGI